MAVLICVDFLPLPIGPTGSPLPIAGFIFSKISVGGIPLLVKTEGGVKGLRFPNRGLRIKLPAPSPRILVRVGRFASQIDVKLYSATGAVVGSAVISATNTYTIRTFRLGTKATRMELIGGNNEAILARICATF